MKFNLYFRDGVPCTEKSRSSAHFRAQWLEKETEILTRYYSGEFKIKPKKRGNRAD